MIQFTKKDFRDFINKDRQKIYFDLYMILTDLSTRNDIISFSYTKPYLMVQVGLNDYYRIKIKEVN